MELIPKSEILNLIPLFSQSKKLSFKQTDILQECMRNIRVYGTASEQF